jgi:hypothetical protein
VKVDQKQDVGRIGGSCPIGRHKRRKNVKMDVKGIEYEGVYWVHSTRNSVKWWNFVTTGMNVGIP